MSAAGRVLGGLRNRRGLVAVLLAIAVTATVAWQARAAGNSLPAPGWAVAAAPVTALLDGDTVTVNVKSNPDVSVYRAEVRECRLGPTYALDDDTSARNGNCPPTPVSSSADIVVSRAAANGLIGAAQSAAGADLKFHIGTGTVNWETPTGTSSLTCDITTQCALVVKLEIGNDVLFQTVPLTFSDADPIVACGGVATGALRAAASDELADAWSSWTRAYCAAQGSGSPSTTAFTGEGSAVTSFLKGDIDVAYGSAGIDPAVGMITSGTAPRGTVAVPVALNAAVLAVGGGHRVFVGGVPTTKDPYPQLQMTVADAAALLGNGTAWFQQDSLPYRNSVLVHNPVLAGVAYWTSANVTASSLPLTSSWLFSKYFTAVTPTDWVYRRDTPPTARGASPSFAAATPPFTDITLLTGRPAMGKVALTASLNDPDGPLWIFTDRATATSLKLTPVALEEPTGATFVAPDNASMTAAVANMKADSQGALQPVIGAATAADGLGTATTTPYPLTYVEYAFVPTEPLVDTTTCTSRTASQALLTNWLDYVTGAGQQNLAAGLEPLPPELAAQAKAAIATVGKAAVTGACAGRTTPESAPGAAAAPPAANGPTTAVPRAVAGLTAPAASATVAGATNGDAAEAKKKSAVVAVPAFAGHTTADPLGGVIAIVGIVFIMSLAAWITAGGAMSGGGQFAPGALGPLTGRRIGSYALLWGGVALAGLGLVLFQLGPLLEQRDQRSLLSSYRVQVKHSAFESQGLGGVSSGSKAPARGSAVGILEISALKAQDVVLEGVLPSQTRQGPGHVPGTAGLGQPGNTVVVARRNGYGGSFAAIGRLRKGDRIVATTTQGQSVYAVSKICEQDVADSTGDASTSSTPVSASETVGTDAAAVCGTTGGSKAGSASGATAGATTTRTAAGATTTTAAGATTTTAAAVTTTTAAGATATTTAGGSGAATAQPASATKSAGASVSKTAIRTVSVDGLYGPSDDDRLTLVTSAAKAPWNTSKATIVVAQLLTKPFEPTTQGTRASGETGFGGDSGAWASVVLCVLAFVGAIVGSVALYRKMRFRIAYLLTIAPLVALTIVAGETIARLLPAWT